MQQKQIQVGNNKLLALDMPVGASADLGIGLGIERATEKRYVFYEQGFPLNPVKLYLPEGIHKIVGFKNDITEEQWAAIVPMVECGTFGGCYRDYVKKGAYYINATESGLSLLQANNIDYLNCLIIQVI